MAENIKGHKISDGVNEDDLKGEGTSIGDATLNNNS